MRRRQDSSYVRHFQSFSTWFQRHIVLLKIVALANSKKNRNIKANDVNLMSMARNTEFCFKTTYLGMFCASDRSYVAFNVLYMVCHPLENSFLWTPYPSEITAFEPPLPLKISNDFPWRGGGGVWIFSGTKQLMNEAEHLMKNYGDRGGCYPSRL